MPLQPARNVAQPSSVALARLPSHSKVSAIVKMDVQSGQVVTRFDYGRHRCGGERMFVPRTLDPAAAKDDGFLLAFCHDESTGTSQLLVLDVAVPLLAPVASVTLLVLVAATPLLTPVASVTLPARVTYGFHGAFIPAADLGI